MSTTEPEAQPQTSQVPADAALASILAPAVPAVAAGVASAAAAQQAAQTILASFRAFLTMRRKELAGWLSAQLAQHYPERTQDEIAELTADELAREGQFSEKAIRRMERDVPRVLAITDPEKRRAAMDALLRREQEYMRMREQAMVDRASALAEMKDVMAASPEGAYWKLDPTVKKHTLDCLLMGEKFWPWSVLKEIHPLLHAGCACHLLTKQEAIERGLIPHDFVVDERDAKIAAAVIQKRVGHLHEAATPEEVEAFIFEVLTESVKDEIAELVAQLDTPCDCGADNLPHEWAPLHGCPPAPEPLQEARKHNAEADAETARIKARAATPEAKLRHEFRPAKWTHSNGHPRCALCGQEEDIGGICNGKPTRAEAQKWADRENKDGMWGNSKWVVGKGGELDLSRLAEGVTLEEAYGLRYAKGDPHGGEFRPKNAVSHIRAEVKKLLRQEVPGRPVPPLQERGKRQGRYVWMRGRYVFVPRNRSFTRKLDSVEFHSPAGGTNIYRNGHLVQIEGQGPPPHHHDLNPPKEADIRNIPGTAEYDPGVKHDPGFPDVNAITPEQMTANMLVWQEEEARRAAARASLAHAMQVGRAAEPPFAIGDQAGAVMDVLQGAGFVGAGTTSHPDDEKPFAGKSYAGLVSRSFTQVRSRARVTMFWERSTGKIKHLSWSPPAKGWDQVHEPANHPPATWEEWADEVRGIAERIGEQTGQRVMVGEVVNDPEMGDHAGSHSSFGGEIRLGADTADVVTAAMHREQPTAGAKVMDAEERRSVWASYKVGTHEAIHGVHPIQPRDYVGIGKAIEEACTEELAHVEAARLLRQHGELQPLQWLRANPLSQNAQGTYHAYRAQLDRVLNVARIAPELREDFIRDLKFMQGPDERVETLTNAVRANALDPTLHDEHAARQFVLDTLSRGAGKSSDGLTDTLRFVPVLRPDLTDFSAGLDSGLDDGAMWNGKWIRRGSTVRIESGERVNGRWRKKLEDVKVLDIGQPDTPGFKFKLRVRYPDGTVGRNVLDASVADVLDTPEPGTDDAAVDLTGPAFELGGKRVSAGAIVRLKHAAMGRVSNDLVVTGMDNGFVMVASPDRFQSGMPVKPEELEVVNEGPAPNPVKVGDLIRYAGRADGGVSEARVTQVLRTGRGGAYAPADVPEWAIEAVTTDDSLKPGQVVMLTPERMGQFHVTSEAPSVLGRESATRGRRALVKADREVHPEVEAAGFWSDDEARRELGTLADTPQYAEMGDEQLLSVQDRLSKRIHGNPAAGVEGLRQRAREADQGHVTMTPTERDEHEAAERRYRAVNAHVAARKASAEAARVRQAKKEAAEKGLLTISRPEYVEMLGKQGDAYADAGYRGDYNPDLFLTSDLSGRGIRHYVTLPDGRVAHPDELHDARRRGRLVVVDKVQAPLDRPRYRSDQLSAGVQRALTSQADENPFDRVDEVMRAMGAHELETGAEHRPDLYDPPRALSGGGWVQNRNQTPRPALIHRVGEPLRIHDTVPPPHFFPNEIPVEGSERPPRHLFRAVSEDDYQQALSRGVLQSDGRMNLGASEGTVAAVRDPTWYLPGKLGSDPYGTKLGRVLRIDYHDEDGWWLDTDGYAKTPLPIPMSRVSAAPQFATTKGFIKSSITGNDVEHVETWPTGVGLDQLGTKSDPGTDYPQGIVARRARAEAEQADRDARAAAGGAAFKMSEFIAPPKSGKLKEPAKEVLDAIDGLLRLPHLPGPVPLRATAGKNTQGGYVRIGTEVGSEKVMVPKEIRVSVNTDDPEMRAPFSSGSTLVHELGHFIDNLAFAETPQNRGFESDHAAWLTLPDENRRTMIESARLRGAPVALREQYEATPSPLQTWYLLVTNSPEYEGLTGSIPFMHLETHKYLVSPRELWARSFAQWVATRSGNPNLAEWLHAAQNVPDKTTVMHTSYRAREPVLVPVETDTPKYVKLRQWQPESFGPIGVAMDDLFEELGWLHGGAGAGSGRDGDTDPVAGREVGAGPGRGSDARPPLPAAGPEPTPDLTHVEGEGGRRPEQVDPTDAQLAKVLAAAAASKGDRQEVLEDIAADMRGSRRSTEAGASYKFFEARGKGWMVLADPPYLVSPERLPPGATLDNTAVLGRMASLEPGAGTMLLREAATYAADRGKYLAAWSLPGARGFYSKAGMQTMKVWNGGMTTLVWFTPEQARAYADSLRESVEPELVDGGLVAPAVGENPSSLLEALGVPEDDRELVAAELLLLAPAERLAFVRDWAHDAGSDLVLS